MAHPTLLAIQIAEDLEEQIKLWQETFHIELDVDDSTQPERLLEMLEKLVHKAHQEEWPDTKLHRWLGWVMGCMACHNIASLERQKEIVAHAKLHFGEKDDDELTEHHNPDSTFRLDIGGEG